MTIALGIVGLGNILPAYLRTLQRSRLFHIVGVVGSNPASTAQHALALGLPAMTLDALLDSNAEVVLSLTPPLAHHAIGLQVLNAGKHFFTEKPLAATFAQGQELVALAARQGLRLGSAPDTFLGAGAQTVRALLDAGTIGAVRHGTAHFMARGPDEWHPSPAFFYQPGAGPLLDVGVYYLTHLVHHLGPVAQVSGSAHTTYANRPITQGPNAGTTLRVEVPTHLVTHLQFTSGAHVVLTSSFDVWKHGHRPIELYGEEGSLLAPDPNCFGGSVRYAQRDSPWQRAIGQRPHTTNLRGIGLIDMVQSLQANRPHRCGAEMALHVLEVMERAQDAARIGRAQTLTTSCGRPAPVVASLLPDTRSASGSSTRSSVSL
ncbi:MAG: Gfo/Idh/MocA family oxidoreductase [Rhodoferax sp.]|nr:Gfo/Idh/MocA family oxidoreductase [Rhodoferax sp.]